MTVTVPFLLLHLAVERRSGGKHSPGLDLLEHLVFPPVCRRELREGDELGCVPEQGDWNRTGAFHGKIHWVCFQVTLEH